MKMIREVTVYTNGDSSKISTWSNVPFLLTETLQSQGLKVNRVNLYPRRIPEKVYNLFVDRIVRRFYPMTSYSYFRSLLHYYDVKLRVWQAVRKFKGSDAELFLTYSFSALGISSKPSVLFCDRTYEIYIQQFLKRAPDSLERKSIEREEAMVRNADTVISLYPAVAEILRERFPKTNVAYLGNVINCVIDPPSQEIITQKRVSRNILFIGGPHYIQGAECLIEAFSLLKIKMPEIQLDIVAMDSSMFKSLPSGVTCHGYLDKSDFDGRQKYYSLLKDAKLLVNTTPMWSGFSSMIEAMYFYTPVITSLYDEFSETFGLNLKFGEYCENKPAILEEKIEKVFTTDEYEMMCLNAHDAVKDFTWSDYVRKIVGIISTLGNHNQSGGTP